MRLRWSFVAALFFIGSLLDDQENILAKERNNARKRVLNAAENSGRKADRQKKVYVH